MKLIFLVYVMVLFYVASAFAETRDVPSEPPIFLEGITVLATPIDAEDENIEPAHKTVIEGETLRERFTSVPEILNETVGVRVTRFGGLGDFSPISIRGSSSEQVLVYLDGFLLNAAQGGSVDLAKIPVSQIESIEVYRGSMPVTFGQTGIGGLVNIRTKSATREKSMAYQLQYGSFNTMRLNTTFSHKPDKTDVLFGVNYEQSDNDFGFINDNGTQFGVSNDDFLDKRRNAQFESLNLIGKLGYDLNDRNQLRFYYNFLDTDKGVPGLGAFQSDTATFKSASHRFSFMWDAKRLGQTRLNTRFELKYSLKNEAFQDLAGDIGTGGNTDNDNRTQLFEIDLSADRAIGKYQILKTRLQVREERFEPEDKRAGIKGNTTRQRVYTLALEDQVALFDDRFFLTPSLLYEEVRSRFKDDPSKRTLGKAIPPESDDQFLTRQIGLFYRASEVLSFRANFGLYFRRPSFFELFGDRGGTVGVSDLRPEKGLNRDFGLHYSRRFKGLLRKIVLQAAYFDNEAEDLILFIQTSQFTVRPENIAKSRTTGEEFSGRIDIGNHLKLEANYTHQRAKNKSHIPSEKDKFLPGRPVHDLFTKLELYNARFTCYYSNHLTDENYLDRSNQRNAASRQIHNLGFSIKSEPRWSLTLEAKNIGDDQIEDVFGFPLPGRTYFVSIHGTL